MNQFKVKAVRTLYNLIPTHMKRLVLWCSVVSAYRKSNEVNAACLKALNDLLHLAKREMALGMPFVISRVIWEDFNGAVQVLHDADGVGLDPKQRENFRNRFFNAIPDWLKYSEKNVVLKDFDTFMANKAAVMV